MEPPEYVPVELSELDEVSDGSDELDVLPVESDPVSPDASGDEEVVPELDESVGELPSLDPELALPESELGPVVAVLPGVEPEL